MPLVQDLPSAIERDTYVQQLARLLKVDERTLLSGRRPTRSSSRISRRRRPGPKQKDASQRGQEVQTQISPPIKSLEEYCLSIIIRLPELINRVDRSLQQSGLARISANDFQLTDHQEILKVSIESLDQDYLEPLSFALDNLPLPLLEYADNILRQSKNLDPYEERVLKDLLRTFLRLREYNLHQSNNQLRFLMQDAQEQGALLTEEYQKTINQNSLKLRNIQKALGPQMTQAFTG
jgi:DNA primase